MSENKCVIPLVCDIINSNSFSSVNEKLATLKLFFVENKVQMKPKILITSFFKEKNNPETFKNYLVF